MDLSFAKMKNTKGAANLGRNTRVHVKLRCPLDIQVEKNISGKLEYIHLDFRGAVRLEI